MLALRFAPLLLRVGEFTAEERLEIRGIFVGVSLDRFNATFNEDDGGGSLGLITVVCRLPTEGDPAMVGRG